MKRTAFYRNRQFSAVVIAAFLGLMGTISWAQGVENLTPSGTPAPIRAVKLITPGIGGPVPERTFFGQIVARETVDLSFEVGGRLVIFDAEEGQFLSKSTKIAQLDLGPLERATERARLALEQADRDLERASTLASSNIASASRRETAALERDLADVTLRGADDDLENATLEAPFNALVASRLTPNFANVEVGQAIVRLHDMSEVRVEIDVPERLFQQIANTQQVSFFGVTPLIEGEVKLMLREFNAETQTIGQSYRVTLALPDGAIPSTVIPGASMTVIARRNIGASDVSSLPSSAVLLTPDRQERVMVYTPDETGETGKVKWVPVEVSSDTGSRISVKGLEKGAQVVAAGANLLQEGETVRPYLGVSVKE